MWNAGRVGFIWFSWDRIAGGIYAALELWFLLVVMLVSEQNKIIFAVTLYPVFYSHPSLYCCWVVGQVLSATGLLLRFARWIYVNVYEMLGKLQMTPRVAASQNLAVLNWLQELVWMYLLHTPTFSIHNPSVYLVDISCVGPCLSPCLMNGPSSGTDFPLWNCIWVNWPFSWDLEAEGKDRLQGDLN